MLIDNINLNLLRVFECVYRTKSMTLAAQELHMTQSGVSQNIKNLEDLLQVNLFDRIKKRPIPTYKAEELFKICSKSLNDIEQALSETMDVERAHKGKVNIGLPLEFGNNIVLPLLAAWGKEHPNINYHIDYGHISDLSELLLQGELDFAFVDDFNLDRQLKTEKIGDELLILVAAKDYLKEHGPIQNDRKWFESLDYIDYLEGNPIIKLWFKHHYKFQRFEGKLRASLMDIQGMSRMIVLGLGVGILPFHVVKRLESEGHDLHRFEGSGKPLHNPISITYLEKRSMSSAVEETMIYLVNNFKRD